ncbi:MAG: hypothetical protein RSD41_04270 [Kiritimatiellia bacterium]
MKKLALIIFCLLALTGCRKEDWREATLTPPVGLSPAQAQQTLKALDRMTPPTVTILDNGALKVRYNSMNLALRNLTFALENTPCE